MTVFFSPIVAALGAHLFSKSVSFCVAVGAFAAYPFVSLRNCKFQLCALVGVLTDLFREKYFLFFTGAALLLVVYLLLYEVNVLCIFQLC